MPLSFRYTFLLMAAGALLVPGRAGRLALLGLVPLGLGIAAVHVRLGGEFSNLALAAAEGGAPLLFLRVNTGLLLLGLGLLIVGVVVAILHSPRQPAAWIGALLAVGGAAPVLAAAGPLLSYIAWFPTIGAALGIGAGAVAAFLLLRQLRLGRAIRSLDAALLERQPAALLPVSSTNFDLIWVTGFLASAVIMLITPSLRAFCLATCVAGAVSHVLLRRLGSGSPIPVTALFALLMVSVYQYLATIAGDSLLTIGELASAPFSAAAEIRIVPWLAIAAFGFAGLWPLHGLVLPLAAPLAGIVLVRLGAHVLPTGMEHWAPFFIPLALIGVWHSTVPPDDARSQPRRWIELLTGMAVIGVFTGGEGVLGAYWLLTAAAILPLTALVAPITFNRRGFVRLLGLPVAWGMLLVISGGLAAQVTYTVLAAAAIAVVIWMYTARE